MRKPNKAAPAHGGDGQLRIIAGQWRSRQFNFPMAAGLRPTPNRVRETLFNWLAPYVEGAKVLDLFAGSGALFLEALSRGAGSALALDLNPAAIASLRSHLQTLKCDNGQLQQIDALLYLQNPTTAPYDLVFLDPPFGQELLLPACTLLEQNGWLAADAWVYTESEQPPSSLGLPVNWRQHREQKAGQVYYALWQRTAVA
ncbi:MAG: 16S rRNA (guanine(966)-N(2))-methyltransferase RsmD [Gammaproteobacteria bacterium]|nr:16S rRNA (guanine(966)-N(2))-methyltransferase RsmD [Gammaproteobacteria bacterium]MBU1488865.1 16S rRNA (guanine(966)-N(2))-methyltransferase RsmD [Gammaproteobacteria bacterium]MBU2067420.1 16S rRNA (guanine(966)-N(2))-methyltransferase RsmD [Gammaproteobacteria bacterium]MBU2138855.1 16S rRNA (guanine(966)-N(2))-methyltransferase RsmD [Gammaproteobacteria bacterium]MBU2216678.1 16S rRNA (guanine(966)-N(2))-methyltransferase RsmD [Gammaproteobacteria bacterium]